MKAYGERDAPAIPQRFCFRPDCGWSGAYFAGSGLGRLCAAPFPVSSSPDRPRSAAVSGSGQERSIGERHLFTGGTIWTGSRDADALLVSDGVVHAVGDEARDIVPPGAEKVDLGGGFLMPSFGDGHAHPLYGGLEAAGPAVRSCRTVDEILLAVKRYADEHPEEWIVGASYDGSLAPGTLRRPVAGLRGPGSSGWSCAPGTITRSGV